MNKNYKVDWKNGGLTSIVAIFLAIALLMLGIATASAVGTARSLSREQSAAGQVVDIVARTDSTGQVFYYPVVEFYLPDETLQTVQLAGVSSAPAYVTGQQVTVLYDPERPLSARIDSAGGALLMWIVPIITGVIGLAFLAATVFARWALRSELTG